MKGLRGIFKINSGHHVTFSTSSSLNSRNIKRRRKFIYADAHAFRANNWLIDRYKQPDLYEGQMKRRQWDYPLGDDQRSSWKHWRWIDPFYMRWVDMTPKPSKTDFDPNCMEKRQMIHDQDSVQMKFALLLDKDRKRKYVTPCFNMEFDQNLSYFYQYLTKTKFVHGLPYNVDSIVIEESEIEEFEQFLTCVLQTECKYNDKTINEKGRKDRADRIISSIVHYLLASHPLHPDLEHCSLDKNPQNSMYWHRGQGFHKYNVPELPFSFQSHDTPLYQIRIREPLQEFSPWMDEFMLSGELPHTDHLPYVYGMKRLLYRNTIAPGFRFKGGDVLLNYHEAYRSRLLSQLPPPVHDPYPHGHTQFISLPESFSMQSYEANLEHCNITDQIEEHIKGHGVMSGWTWSAAQAHYKGYWMDNDVESPFCIQTIISDGSHFAFFCYQLNTLSVDPENVRVRVNQRRNLCYGTQLMKLFDVVDGTDDILLHRDTTTLLLKFIKNNSTRIVNAEETAQHNAGLEVQKWNGESPHIELQIPKHVREKTTASEIAKQEEITRNRTWANKFIDWVKT